MTSVSAVEAKTRFGELLERVMRGEEVVITRHEKPVARLVPEGRPDLKQVRQAVADLRDLQRRIAARTAGRPKLTYAEIKSAVAEGRP
jgi:prevent-host-death family protein